MKHKKGCTEKKKKVKIHEKKNGLKKKNVKKNKNEKIMFLC